jgi:hypothetical protein
VKLGRPSIRTFERNKFILLSAKIRTFERTDAVVSRRLKHQAHREQRAFLQLEQPSPQPRNRRLIWPKCFFVLAASSDR